VPQKECLVRLSKAEKDYGAGEAGVKAVRQASQTLESGEFVLLQGPSGSGKTTLLSLMGCLLKPTSGRVCICGQDVTDWGEGELPRLRLRHIGFIFQLYNLMPVLTAFENVELPLLLTPLTRKERKARAELALNLVGLGDRIDHYPRQLSGGQEQRVAIARAIVTDPVLVVADEPTGDLDAHSAEEILGLLDRMNREFGKTILMVTHDPKAAQRAHRLVHHEKGVLLREEGVA